MAELTIAEINSAIEADLSIATGLTFTQDLDELTEQMPDTPTLQVYWQATQTDPGSGTAKRSFGNPGIVVRQTDLTFRADLFARQRSHIGEDMAALVPLIDAIQTRLEAQQEKPYFSLADIQAILGWSAEQVVWEYPEGSQTFYIGARFDIRVRVF